MAAPDWERGLKRLRAKPGSENVWVPQHEAAALAAEFDRLAGAEERFAAMKERVEASRYLDAIRSAILRGCVCGRPAHDYHGADIDAYHDENDCRACAAARELLTLVAVVNAAARLRRWERRFDALRWQDRLAVAMEFIEDQRESRVALDAALDALDGELLRTPEGADGCRTCHRPWKECVC